MNNTTEISWKFSVANASRKLGKEGHMKSQKKISKERLGRNMTKYTNAIRTGPFQAPKPWGDTFQTPEYLLNYDRYDYETGSLSEKKTFGMIIFLLASTIPYLSSLSDVMLILGKEGQFPARDWP